MTEDSSLDSKIAQLTKRIDDQARFTRTLVVVCTASIMGVFFYLLTELYGHYPLFTFNFFMQNMDKLYYEWRAIDVLQKRQESAAATKAQEAPKTEAPKKD